MPDKPALRLAATAAAFLIAAGAWAQTPPARLAEPGTIGATAAAGVLSPHDRDAMTRALAAARAGNWAQVRTIRNEVQDPVGRKLLQWRLATGDNRSGFSELSDALRNLQGWPSTNAIQRDTEFALGDMAAGAVPRDMIVRWFLDFPAQSGEGKVAHAMTLIALGFEDDARVILRDAWRDNTLRTDTQRGLIASHAHLFPEEDTLRRIEFLVWGDQRTQARDLLPLLSSQNRQLWEARLAMATGASDADTRVAQLPAHLQNEAGILFERARNQRQAGRTVQAAETLRRIETNPQTTTALNELWRLRRVLARETLEEGNTQTAYDLVSNIGLTSGANFADAEFMAGWIALRFLDRAETAEQHFVTLATGVSTPVSVSRGWYWAGEARAALGDMDGARGAWAAAAEHSTAYYGQLALMRLDPGAMIVLPPDAETHADARARFEARDLTLALRMLGELGEAGMFNSFAIHLEGVLEDAAEVALLTDLAHEYAMTATALRVAKNGRNRNMAVLQRAYPVAFTAPEGLGFVEPALTLAISRQETEFDPRAVSRANARGLMQLIPTTAREQARRSGMEYRESWLLDDPEYNVRLGSAHLDSLIQNYNGSYIVSMAAYNAGPGRARQWIERFGDPRQGQIDPVDWVEWVPFEETRNYIMRVMENLQVYRAQLAEDGAPLDIAQDMRRGEVPMAAFR